MKFKVACLAAMFTTMVVALPLYAQKPPPKQAPPKAAPKPKAGKVDLGAFIPKAGKVDLGAFVKEVMQIKVDDDQIQMAMWLPIDFFVQAARAEGTRTKAEVEKEIGFLRPYLCMIVQCQRGDGFYASEQEIRSRAVLRLSNGTEIRALDAVPPAVSGPLGALKAALSEHSGGANLQLLIFAAAGKDGKPIIDTAAKGKLTLALKADRQFKETVFVWHTPFDAVTPVSGCPKCRESVSAKWSFCPWCGQRITKK